MNTIDRLEELATKASERPWRSVHPYGSIITDGASLAHMDEANRRAYGGGLICESVVAADKDFICAVVNALPDMLAVIRAAAEEHLMTAATAADPERGDCKTCRALAPLFAETALVERQQ